MGKYVKLDDVIELLANEWGYVGMREELYALPDADVEPVRHGKWVFRSRWHDSIDENICSECEQMLTTAAGKQMNYCPKCGARMDGGADE